METSVRRRTGFALGFVLGLAHAIVSNLINSVYMPDIPLFIPPPGTFGLILLTSLLFGLLGLLAAWMDESLPSILFSAFIGSIISSLWVVLNEPTNRGTAFVLLFLIFLPRMFFYLPLSLGVRWLLSRLEPTPFRVVPPVQRLAPIFIAILMALASGLFSLEGRETRQSLTKMNELIQASVHAGSRSELPKSLQSVEGFTSRAKGGYTFFTGPNPDVLPVQRPMMPPGTIEPFIIVQYENGFRFGCVFSPPYETPACIDF